jgi:two-component system phosphate regulon sensor histidine kinase PhoR
LREPALAPAGLFLLKRLAGRLGTPEEGRLINDRIEWAERAEELKRIAPELLARHGTGGGERPVWTVYGDPPWLVTVDTAPGAPEKLVIAVRADALPADAGVPGASLSTRETADNLPLGDPFPRLRLQLPASYDALAGEEFQTRERFLWAALALVLVVTFFAGFLSWTDMRREIASAKVRTEFVESVTHELRTPLASIRMFAETLRHRAPADGQLHAECLDTIIGESERLARLVDNVLDFSRIEQGRKIYRLAPVELSRVVEAVVRTMRYPLERKHFSLEVMVNPDLPAIAADADSLEQAILNLLSNAVKYSGEAREIRLTVDRDGDDAVIRVQDKGVGIAPEEHRRIFERFYRAPAPASGETTGAGLGLTLVEHIARAHGGSVTVESAPGRGSTFSIRLPIGGPA